MTTREERKTMKNTRDEATMDSFIEQIATAVANDSVFRIRLVHLPNGINQDTLVHLLENLEYSVRVESRHCDHVCENKETCKQHATEANCDFYEDDCPFDDCIHNSGQGDHLHNFSCSLGDWLVVDD